jgi:predicted transcriptional regulator of viral defense system
MNDLSGLGKLDRKMLTLLLRKTQGVISVAQTAEILEISRPDAGKRLARWALKGWLSRIKRGVYIPVPLESTTANISLEDPWIIAEYLYHPCYIAGWSAGEYWGLTEQIFRTVVVKTTQKPNKRRPVINGTQFLLITTPQKIMFGLKTLWRGQTKILMSDPTRTIVDFLDNPTLAGGIRPTIDMLNTYLQSEHKDLPLLAEYAKRMNNRAVFKRLGFLLECYAPAEKKLISICQKNLSAGKSQLDPKLKGKRLITRWHLWVPQNWKD